MNYTFHWAPAVKALPQLLWGALATLEIAVLSMALGVTLAIMLALFSSSNSRLLRAISSIWVEIARNTPALFQVYMVYFGLGSIGLRHYDVQLVGGAAIHNRSIAELVTGEGKTLVSTLPAYLNALQG